MTDLRIALDLEGVLANPHCMVRDYTERFDEEDLETFGFDEEDLEHFHDITHHIWENDMEKIPATEDDLWKKIDDLRKYGEVELVTNTPGPKEQVLEWLEMNYITLDGYNFPGPGTMKADLDYDVYIDDNPYMPGDEGVELLYFYTQDYNEVFGHDGFIDADIEDITYYDLTVDDPIVMNSVEDKQTVVRVDSIEHVCHDLEERNVPGRVVV